MSLKRLESMFDRGERLFCFRTIFSNENARNEGLSFRYSIISLLGLYKHQLHGDIPTINLRDATERLIERSKQINSIGDMGLLLWLLALYCPDNVGRLDFEAGVHTALERYDDARAVKTTELAWFLTGLSYLALKNINALSGLKELTTRTYGLLKKNYGQGIFRHQSPQGLAGGALRSRMGTFADQVYPIYAFTRFAQACGHEEAMEIAFQCGKTICSLQGPVGQWWWHYDAVNGNVVGRYPVFSVHQYGMAPMALFTLAEATGTSFDQEIYKGLDWVAGSNELGINMVDIVHAVVWRSIYRPSFRMRLEELSSFVTRCNEKEPNDLKVLHECRPYCFGWFLYAFPRGGTSTSN